MAAGKIEACFEYWQNELQAPPFVLNVVKNGYSLPFDSTPESSYAKNNASSLKHKKFVETSINELIKNKCIEEVSEVPYCVNPLTVAEGEKLRLVLDLRHVNKHLKVQKFR